MKKTIISLLMVCVMVLMSGCMYSYDTVIKENGTAEFSFRLEVAKELDTSDSFKDIMPSNAVKTTKKVNGVEYNCYTVNNTYPNLNALKAVLTNTNSIGIFSSLKLSATEMIGETLASQDLKEYYNLSKSYGENYSVKGEFAITMPNEVILTNGTVNSSNSCKVQWSVVDYIENGTLYVYCKNSPEYTKVLNDKKAPVITGVKNNGNYKFANYKCTDDTVVKEATLNKKKAYAKDTIYTDGVYTLAAKDLNGNTASVKFTVDTKAPVINGIKNNKKYGKAVKLKVSDKNGLKFVKLNGKKQSLKKAKSGITVKKSGSYKVIAQDKAGNQTIMKFKIKKK